MKLELSQCISQIHRDWYSRTKKDLELTSQVEYEVLQAKKQRWINGPCFQPCSVFSTTVQPWWIMQSYMIKIWTVSSVPNHSLLLLTANLNHHHRIAILRKMSRLENCHSYLISPISPLLSPIKHDQAPKSNYHNPLLRLFLTNRQLPAKLQITPTSALIYRSTLSSPSKKSKWNSGATSTNVTTISWETKEGQRNLTTSLDLFHQFVETGAQVRAHVSTILHSKFYTRHRFRWYV